jgi:hypothetical protein
MSRLSLRLVLSVSAIVLGACSDERVSAPVSRFASSIEEKEVNVVQRATANPGGSATQIIGPSGGSISVAGVTITLQAGAVTEPTAITVNVPAGRDVAAEFLPHGLTFKKPVSISFNLEGTLAENATANDAFGATYSVGVPQNGRARAIEPFMLVVKNKTGTLQTTHFSTYEVSFMWSKGWILVGG